MIAIVTEPIARRVVNSHKKDPETGRVHPKLRYRLCVSQHFCVQ